MQPISNVDRLVLLLRQRLAERGKASRPSAATAGAAAPARAAPSALQALAGVDGVDERHLRRALIQDLLSDSFGERAINDAQFQRVVDRVTETIEGDPQAAKLLQRVLGDLTAPAR